MFKIGNDWTKWLMLAPDGGEGGGGNDPGDGGAGSGDDGANGGGGQEKTFTQEQVNSMIAAEKRKSLSSVYKTLGFESEEAAKEFVGKYKQEEEKNKSDLVKEQEKNKQLEAEKKAEQAKAQDLQYKFDAISEGADAKAAEDVVVLAKAKMSDEKDFATALKEVKEQYPAMFGQSSNGGGTGGGGTPPKSRLKAGDVTGIGKRLAEQRKQNNSAQDDNKYFK